MEIEKGVVTSKGQVVIPARLRRRLGIRKGTVLSFREDGGRLVVQPLSPEFLRTLRGSLKGNPSPLDLLLEDRGKDRAP
jgi:AbrB family looped-hinge helix DNA binding protein